MSTARTFPAFAPLLTALALSLTACATPLPQPVQPPKVPPPPQELMTPPEPGTYSDAFQNLLRKLVPLLMPAKSV